MYPINNYESIRRGHEELLKRAAYERMARKANIERKMSSNIHSAANWLGLHLVRWGEKLEQFGNFSKVQHSHATPNRSKSM